MKKLFIIRTIIKDWFTTQLPYTIIIILAFCVSFLALFFISTRIASENLAYESIEDVYYNELQVDYGRILGLYGTPAEIDDYTFSTTFKNRFQLNDEFYEEYLKIGLPTLGELGSGANINGDLLYSKKNGEKLPETDFVEVPLYPKFAASEREKYEPFKYIMRDDYIITKGRDITAEELEEGKGVAIAPEGWAVDVGDVLELLGNEGFKVEIVGLYKPAPTRVVSDVWISNFENFFLPYRFINKISEYPLDNSERDDLIFNQCYTSKPINNQYVLDGESGHTSLSVGPTDPPRCAAEVFLDVDSWYFTKKITENQKEQIAALMNIDPKYFTNSYDLYYYKNVNTYKKQVRKECLITGLFCVINVFTVVIFLCRRNTKAYRTYRVYGCSGWWIFLINLFSMLAVTAVAFGISLIAARPALALFRLVNSKYEFRTRCLAITSAVFLGVSLLACIPAAISAVRHSPIDK